MKSSPKTALQVALAGAVGSSVLIFHLGIFGFVQPSMDGQRGTIGTLVLQVSTPLICAMDWMTQRHIIYPDNMLAWLYLWFQYWALLGAVVALGCYGLVCLLAALLTRTTASRSPGGP